MFVFGVIKNARKYVREYTRKFVAELMPVLVWKKASDAGLIGMIEPGKITSKNQKYLKIKKNGANEQIRTADLRLTKDCDTLERIR